MPHSSGASDTCLPFANLLYLLAVGDVNKMMRAPQRNCGAGAQVLSMSDQVSGFSVSPVNTGQDGQG